MCCNASVRPEAASGSPRVVQLVAAAAAGLALWLTGAGLVSTAAEAQGFFQSLFGGSSRPPAPQPPPQASLPLRAPGAAIPFRGAGELGRLTLPRSTPDTGEAPVQGGGTFRTVCVRLCDGYFFPVSSQTSRRGFYRDAGLCRSRCGDQGRLFFAPAPGVDIAQMRDLTGRSYPALNNAFLYRKSYVPSCRCRPEPWSATEIMRHARYAAAEDAARPRRPSVGLIGSRPVNIVAAASLEPPAPPADPERKEAIRRPLENDGSMTRPGPDTGDVAKAGPAPDPTAEQPDQRSKPLRVVRKPAREKAPQVAGRKPRAPAAAIARPAAVRPPAVVGAPRQVWPGDRPG